MVASLHNSMVCPVLIGRSTQFDTLNHLIAQAHSGQGGIALIAGEAGIGKSRLVAEVKTVASHQGFAILQGHCFEPDRLLPYAPLLDLLRTQWAGQSITNIATTLGPAAANLMTLLPELQAVFSELPSYPSLEPNQERYRLAQTFVHFFTQFATQHPLLIVVEDLHWSDEASLDVLLTQAHRIAPHAILLLLTYRNEELSPELAAFLAALDRERLATPLTLPRLTVSDVNSLLRAILDLSRPIRPDFLRAIYAVTEGNPFFIEEVLKSLVTTAENLDLDLQSEQPLSELRLPRSIQTAVQRRLTQVSPAARELLTLAAVAGRRFDFQLLQALTKYDEGDLIRLIKDLIQAQLVVEESADTFAFRHALTQQAVTADLLRRERRRLHHTIAETMERLYEDTPTPPVADLARHFFAAELWPKALAYARRAGEQAQTLYAPRAAIEQFTRALDAAHRLGLHPSPEIARARGQMYEVLGMFDVAQADYLQAFEAAHSAQNHQEAWQSLLALGWLWTGRDYARAGDYLQRGIAQARAMGDAATLAQTLNRVGNWHVHAEQPQEGLRYHQEALSIFQALQDRPGQAATLDLLAIANFMGGDLLIGKSFYEQAISLFRDLGDFQGLATTLAPYATRGANYMHDTMAQVEVDLATSAAEGEEAIALARQIDWRPGEAQALMYLGLSLGARGIYLRAIEALEAGQQIASDIEHHVWMAGCHFTLSAVYGDLLLLPEARQHAEQAFELAQQIGSRFLIWSSAAFLVLACNAQGDLARARAVLDGVADPEMPMQTLAQRLVWRAWAELALADHEPALALQLVTRLVESAVYGHEPVVIPRLSYLRGLALMENGHFGEAELILSAAQTRAAALGAFPLLWRIDAALGKLYQANGQRDQARELTTQAQQLIDRLADGLPDTLQRAFVQNATAQLSRLPTASPRQSAKLAFGGLTQREREITALITQGKSNRAVADALVLSERTVAKHVENILSKLHFTSRAQIAAWAVEKGLGQKSTVIDQ